MTVATSTAPAATSLAIFTSGWYEVTTASIAASTAVFIISATSTRLIAPKIAASSRRLKSSSRPITSATTAAATWICMFRWVRST